MTTTASFVAADRVRILVWARSTTYVVFSVSLVGYLAATVGKPAAPVLGLLAVGALALSGSLRHRLFTGLTVFCAGCLLGLILDFTYRNGAGTNQEGGHPWLLAEVACFFGLVPMYLTAGQDRGDRLSGRQYRLLAAALAALAALSVIAAQSYLNLI